MRPERKTELLVSVGTLAAIFAGTLALILLGTFDGSTEAGAHFVNEGAVQAWSAACYTLVGGGGVYAAARTAKKIGEARASS